MNTQSKDRFLQQLRLFEKAKVLLKKKVSDYTITYLFLLHLISGMGQAAAGGFTSEEFSKDFHIVRYKDWIDRSFRVLNRFFKNEQATVLGRMRLRVFLSLLKAGKKTVAGRIMGLK